MKTAIAIFTILTSVTVSGCWFGDTSVSPQGGTISQDEKFSITVPTTNTLKQGTEMAVLITLNRGAYFKRDVQLNIVAEGISVSPANVLVKASDKPDMKVQIVAAQDAALGDYRVSVKGTPLTGKATSTEFTVRVVSP